MFAEAILWDHDHLILGFNGIDPPLSSTSYHKYRYGIPDSAPILRTDYQAKFSTYGVSYAVASLLRRLHADVRYMSPPPPFSEYTAFANRRQALAGYLVHQARNSHDPVVLFPYDKHTPVIELAARFLLQLMRGHTSSEKYEEWWKKAWVVHTILLFDAIISLADLDHHQARRSSRRTLDIGESAVEAIVHAAAIAVTGLEPFGLDPHLNQHPWLYDSEYRHLLSAIRLQSFISCAAGARTQVYRFTAKSPHQRLLNHLALWVNIRTYSIVPSSRPLRSAERHGSQPWQVACHVFRRVDASHPFLDEKTRKIVRQVTSRPRCSMDMSQATRLIQDLIDTRKLVVAREFSANVVSELERLEEKYLGLVSEDYYADEAARSDKKRKRRGDSSSSECTSVTTA